MTSFAVSVDLGLVSDDDLEAEYESRNLDKFSTPSREYLQEMERLYELFHMRQLDKAMALAKQLAQDHTGRVL